MPPYDVGCRCKVVAGEFQEYSGNTREKYIEDYVGAILKKQRIWRGKPSLWGLHDYRDLVQVDQKHPHVTTAARRFMRLATRLGHPHMWITEAGVEQQAGNHQTNLAGLNCKYPLNTACKLQELAAKDFLQLGGVSGRHGKGHIERVYYSLYKGPTNEQKKEQKKPHLFDSALLEGNGPEPRDWRPAYCVLAFSHHHCPPLTVTKGPVLRHN